VWPLLRALGQPANIHFIGPLGTAAGVKLALNQLIASLTVRQENLSKAGCVNLSMARYQKRMRAAAPVSLEPPAASHFAPSRKQQQLRVIAAVAKALAQRGLLRWA
jgi:hypothetical protein